MDMEAHSIGGAPYYLRMYISRSWLTVLNAFTLSTNSTYIGRLWLFLMRRCVLIVKVPYWQPTPGVEPN